MDKHPPDGMPRVFTHEDPSSWCGEICAEWNPHADYWYFRMPGGGWGRRVHWSIATIRSYLGGYFLEMQDYNEALKHCQSKGWNLTEKPLGPLGRKGNRNLLLLLP